MEVNKRDIEDGLNLAVKIYIFGNRVGTDGPGYYEQVAQLEKYLPEIFKQAGIDAATRYEWAQKAGCDCGCSPGFVLERTMCCRGFEVFVDL